MSFTASVILVLLWFAWVVQAMVSILAVRKMSRRGDESGRSTYLKRYPLATVIVPFKGADPSLPKTIRALLAQDYPDHRLLLVVDSTNDPAYPVLVQATQACESSRVEVLVAGLTGPHEGQKVHNQLHAIDHLESGASEDDVWVFADSDAVPEPHWLGELIGPLHKKGTGLSTGYRWLVPADGLRASIWCHLASVMNSSVACLFGRDAFNHAWGGSMALRVETARRGELRRRLVGALCDDYQFTRMVSDLNLRISFVPLCLVVTPVEFNLAGLINFAHRQYLLTRVYAPKLFLTALGLTGLYVAGFLSAWVSLIMALYSNSGLVWTRPAVAILLVALANQFRASVRRRAIRAVFGDTMLERLKVTLRYDRWATALWMTLHFLLVLRSAIGRRMRWRGMDYRLLGPQRVEHMTGSG